MNGDDGGSGPDSGRAAGAVAGRDSLPVAVSREELHAIETADAFETEGSFVLRVTNHGRDAHVHVKLDDELAAAASIGESNYYVERDGTVDVAVTVDPGATPASGRLTVETGYGAESAHVDVALSEPPRKDVAVDERLGKPQADVARDDRARDLLPVAALAVVATAVAAVTALVVEDPVVIGGVVVVLAGVVTAAILLLR